MKAWKTISSKEIYRNPWISLRDDEVENHNGKRLTYTVVDVNTPSVYMIALNSSGQLLIQKEYRYTIDHEGWSIPAGHSDGDDVLIAAKRELLEETGLESQQWEEIGTVFSLPGIANAPAHVFLARNCRSVSDKIDPDEAISSHRFVEFDEAERMIKDGEIISTSAISAIFKASIHLKGAII